MGFNSLKDVLQEQLEDLHSAETLDEESQADTLLTKIATGGMFKAGINEQATTW